MKTAMQELIDYIEKNQPKNKITDGIWSKAKSLLDLEKEQIIEAHNHGYSQGVKGLNEQATEYYNETFNQCK